MSVSGVEATGIFGMANAPTTSTSSSKDKDMFLQLLVAQMKNQDPSNPADSTQFLSQNAQFTALEKMQAVADQTAQMVALQVAFGASSMVGRTVSYPKEDGTVTSGVVNSVRFESTGAVLQVNGTDVPFGVVQSVGDGTAPTTPA